jgi:hypothetical protein
MLSYFIVNQIFKIYIMDFFNFNNTVFLTCIITLAIWELIWKGIALWKSARNSHSAWFVCLLIFNTLGILPIIYILLHRNEKE